jgi:hypothetical protein
MTRTQEEHAGRQHDRAASGPPSADHVDRTILNLLLFGPGLALWAVDEIVREIGNRIAVEDSLWRLHREGLAHRVDEGFVFASRSAACAAALLDSESERAYWTRGSRG